MEDQKPKLYIVLYSLYHHIFKLATEIAKGAEASGCQVKIFQVEETLSNDILEKMNASDRPDLPIITATELATADGILFGLPTRFGMFPTQIKTLLDATGGLWAKNGLAQKFAGFFISTASSHGGSETTALTAVSYLAHHAITYIPFGYSNPALFDNTKLIGGSPYGSTTIANGDGSRLPIDEELEMALNQGENFGKILVIYHRGVQKLLQLSGETSQRTSKDEGDEEIINKDVPDTNDTSNMDSFVPTNDDANVGTGAATAATATATATAAAAAGGSAGLAVAEDQKKKNEPDQEVNQPRPSDEPGDDSFYGSVMGALSSEASGRKKTTAQQGLSDQSNSHPNSQPSHTTRDTEQTTGTFGNPLRQNPLGSEGREDGQPTGVDNTSKEQQQQRPTTQPMSTKKKFLWFCCGNDNDLD